jgi:acetylornithine/succinyldiaminopimelate/putrescine aminotransferase
MRTMATLWVRWALWALKNASKFSVLDTWCRFYYLQQRRRFTKNYYQTAGIILETIQGGAGFIQPQNDFLKKYENDALR